MIHLLSVPGLTGYHTFASVYAGGEIVGDARLSLDGEHLRAECVFFDGKDRRVSAVRIFGPAINYVYALIAE